MRWVLAVVLCLSGCVETGTVPCGDGRCPAGSACDAVHGRCVDPDQLVVCVGLANGVSCELDVGGTGVCIDEVCLQPSCGDGRVEGSEDCDRDNLPATDCMELGYYASGTLTCRDDCSYDVSACSAICGDGVRDDGLESCDESDLGGVTNCTELGYYFSGPVSCNQLCQLNDSACTGYCGDNMVNSTSELCDGAPPPLAACTNFGFDAGAIGCSGFCSPDLDLCAHIGWTQIASFGNLNLDSVWVADASTAFAAGNIGVGKWSAGTWTAQTLPDNLVTYRAVHGTSVSNVIAVGDGGEIAHYDGTTWISRQSGVLDNLHAVFALTPSEAYAVGENGAVVRWNGTAWSVMDAGVGVGVTLSAVWAAASNAVFIARGTGVLHFDGTTWTATPITGVTALWGFAANDVFVIGPSGLAKHYDGTAWSDVPGFPSGAYVGLWGSSRSDLFAVGGSGVIAHYDGTGWGRVGTTTNQNLKAVHGSGPGNVLAVGQNGFVLRYEGAEWIAQPATTGINAGAWGSGVADLFLARNTGVYHFDGTDWSVMTMPVGTGLVRGLWGLHPAAVWATTASGQILRYDGSWTLDESLGSGFYDVWGVSDDNIYAVGDSGVTHYDGATWSTLADPAGSRLRGVWGTGPSDVFAVAGNGVVVHNNGTAWSTVFTASGGLFDVWASGPRDVFAVGNGGLIVHYDGTSWTYQESPTTVTLEAVYGSGPADVFASGGDGVVLHYDGMRWSPVDSQTAGTLRGLWTTPRFTIVGGPGIGDLLRLDRTVPWACTPTEVSCGDGADNDCDGRIDIADPDCTVALRLSEVHGGAAPYVELINRTTATANLHGISLTARGSCNVAPVSYSFPPDAIVGPGEVYRAYGATSGLLARERPLLGGLCTPTAASGGWYALCAGPCDLVTCSNVIDYVEVGARVAPPACASFAPAPVSVTGATATQSATRTGFSGGGAIGSMADWTLGTATRD